MCDVAQMMLLEQAEAEDVAAQISGVERPSRKAALLDVLGFSATTDEGDDGDADVIVLAEYTPRELAKELGLRVT